ncbi:MAG: hypothetical protein ABIP50_00965 [Candidatus Saccharimonadales bacterium]
MMKKLSRELNRKKQDIDWLQSMMETFLILNSRFYEDLIIDLVKNVRKYHTLPPGYTVTTKLREYEDTLSSKYHKEKMHKRHRAAHGSNYERIGVPEFGNDILPRPITYTTTMQLANMAKRKDLIKMWQNDMNQCADDINTIFNAVVDELNTLEDLPKLNPHQNPKAQDL